MSDIKTSDEELRSKVTETIRQVAWMWEPMARDLPESCTRDVEFIMSLIKSCDQQIALAYGGCTNCYGKGYATQSSRASGRGISWDTSGIKFCECPRGQQLEVVTEQIALAAQRQHESELEEAERFNYELGYRDSTAEEVIEARIDEVNNIVKDEYFHPSGRHMGAVKYHVQRYKELTASLKQAQENQDVRY